jgi:hypothetical protein
MPDRTAPSGWTERVPGPAQPRPPAPAAAASPTATADGRDPCAHDASVEADVSTSIHAALRQANVEPEWRAQVTYECPRRAAPRHFSGLRSDGEGTRLDILDADAPSDDRVDIRLVVLDPREKWPTLDVAPTLETARASVRDDRARQALRVARAALAAHVVLIAPDGLRVAGVTQTSEENAVSLSATGVDGPVARGWVGPSSAEPTRRNGSPMRRTTRSLSWRCAHLPLSPVTEHGPTRRVARDRSATSPPSTGGSCTWTGSNSPTGAVSRARAVDVARGRRRRVGASVTANAGGASVGRIAVEPFIDGAHSWHAAPPLPQ